MMVRKALRGHREVRGLSQKDLARRLGVNPATLGNGSGASENRPVDFPIR
jgi:transcriptional regulator with XRE-family HTH domain